MPLRVNSVPHVRLIPPSAADPKADSIKMEPADLSNLANSMAAFIASRTKLSVGPINRPPAISNQQITIIIAIVLIATPFIVKRLISGRTILHRKGTWMLGAISIYLFSVSGTMFNIIRKMPMFLTDRNDPEKSIFFYKGSGLQLGIEGFAMGILFTMVGVLLGFVTHGLFRVKRRHEQRLLMLVAMIVMLWAVRQVVSLSIWKTGYRIRYYCPSRWHY